MFVGILLVLFVTVCALLVMVILLQSGKGEGLGVTFGGSSQTVFGGRGAADFLTKATTYLAIGYLVLSLLLSKFYQRTESEKLTVPQEPAQTQTKSDEKAKPTAPATTPATSTQQRTSPAKPASSSSPNSDK